MCSGRRWLASAALQDLPGHGRGRRQDLPHAPGGQGRAGRRARRRDRLPRAARARPRPRPRPRGSSGCRGARWSTAARPSRRWTCRRSSSARPTLCLIDELAHTNAPGLEHAQALRGHRGRARRRHRRVLDRQRPAPRVAQRPGRRADRRARARDVPRPGARLRRRGGAGRPHARGPDRAAARRQGLPGRARAGRAQQLLPRREPGRAARGGAAPDGRGGGVEARGRRPPSCSAPARSCSPTRRRRRWPSACWRWSPRARARSGSCAGPGARPSGSAPSSTSST